MQNKTKQNKKLKLKSLKGFTFNTKFLKRPNKTNFNYLLIKKKAIIVTLNEKHNNFFSNISISTFKTNIWANLILNKNQNKYLKKYKAEIEKRKKKVNKALEFIKKQTLTIDESILDKLVSLDNSLLYRNQRFSNSFHNFLISLNRNLTKKIKLKLEQEMHLTFGNIKFIKKAIWNGFFYKLERDKSLKFLRRKKRKKRGKRFFWNLYRYKLIQYSRKRYVFKQTKKKNLLKITRRINYTNAYNRFRYLTLQSSIRNSLKKHLTSVVEQSIIVKSHKRLTLKLKYKGSTFFKKSQVYFIKLKAFNSYFNHKALIKNFIKNKTTSLKEHYYNIRKKNVNLLIKNYRLKRIAHSQYYLLKQKTYTKD